jgi:hypothetical protein
MFLSLYCDYTVDEIGVIFCILQFFSLKMLIFGGQLRPPKISGYRFRRRSLAAENKGLFSVDFFWWLGTVENKPKAAENSIFSAASGHRKCMCLL